MRYLVLLVTTGALFGVLSRDLGGSVVIGTLLPVALAIVFAVVVAGRPCGMAITSGALAAFLGSFAWSSAPWLAGALVVGLGYVERTIRVRTARARVGHLVLALSAGASAGFLSATYAGSPVTLLGVALVLCAVVSMAPLLLEADDPRVVALESAATRLGPRLCMLLREAADLLRCTDLRLMDRETAAQVMTSWRALERLIDARLRLHTPPKSESATLVLAMLDRQITQHVESLLRTIAAATTMGAAEAGLDDTAMREVHVRGEVLEEQSRAIVEVRGG